MIKSFDLPLDIGNGLNKKIYIKDDLLKQKRDEIDLFLDDENALKNISFATNTLFFNEIQSNNSIEGYHDDIVKINDVVKNFHKLKSKPEEDKKRIMNLFKSYEYILKEKNINKDTLKKLNDILSNGLITEWDLRKMGDYYREGDVFIFYSADASKLPDKGVDPSKVEYYMNKLFSFINTDFNSNSLTDEFIKSQIMHFYFVYIHPYFDTNGRTARTTSMWYLLNKKAYPYLIFNRGIDLSKNDYYKVIKKTKENSNITDFASYMLNSLYSELEKEHIIQNIKSLNDLNEIDYQTLHYILSMNGNLSLLDFSSMYNKYNNKKRVKDIDKEMIRPLIDKGILQFDRKTDKKYDGINYNYIFDFDSLYKDADSKSDKFFKRKKKEK
ncbi:MAG: Fic family protein [Bacilli bacterium]|nr:Fic family protein [Bacilli bacterium]